jgi:hypothetical protein
MMAARHRLPRAPSSGAPCRAPANRARAGGPPAGRRPRAAKPKRAGGMRGPRGRGWQAGGGRWARGPLRLAAPRLPGPRAPAGAGAAGGPDGRAVPTPAADGRAGGIIPTRRGRRFHSALRGRGPHPKDSCRPPRLAPGAPRPPAARSRWRRGWGRRLRQGGQQVGSGCTGGRGKERDAKPVARGCETCVCLPQGNSVSNVLQGMGCYASCGRGLYC